MTSKEEEIRRSLAAIIEFRRLILENERHLHHLGYKGLT